MRFQLVFSFLTDISNKTGFENFNCQQEVVFWFLPIPRTALSGSKTATTA
jgi:hypothetical protein